MNDAEIRATIARAEEHQRRDPAGYERHLAMLALAGYAYLFAVTIGFVLLAILLFVALVYFHFLILIKFSFIILITVWLIIKSMWVKFPVPEGIRINNQQAPQLFKLIEKVQAAAKGPHIDEVVVDGTFNCAIVQVPRLGIFGFHKNYVLLGVPLLESISEKEFAAVLGHEMGHLSKKHGQVGSWIWQVYMSWIQIYVTLARESAFGTAPIKKFAAWYLPYFDAHSQALRRAHEYAADQIGTDIADARTMARALATTAIKGDYLGEKYWPSVIKQVETSEEPPKAVYDDMSVKLNEPIDHATMVNLLQQNWRKHKPMDSHPSLSERVQALEPDRNWDVPSLADEIASTPPSARSAAQAVFGDATLADLHRQLNQEWYQNSLVGWKIKHEHFLKGNAEFARLEELLNTGRLTEPQAAELATACGAVKDGEDAIALLKVLADRFPHEGVIRLNLGMMLLSEKRTDEAIDQLETAVKLEPSYGRDTCSLIAGYLEHINRDDEAARYMQRSEEFEKKMAEAANSVRTLTTLDIFEEHKLSVEAAAKLAAALNRQSYIKQAYLVSKVVPDIVGKHQHVLVLMLEKAFVGHQEKAVATINALVQMEECAGFYIITWDLIKPNLANACKTFPSALIYARATYTPDSVPVAPASPTHLVYSIDAKPASKPSFFRSHRGNLIAAAIILFFVLAGIGTSSSFKRVEEEEQARKQQQVVVPDAPRSIHYNDYGSYMAAVQIRIKHHWHPPKKNASNRVVVRFTIKRDGYVTKINIKQSSGDPLVDQAASRAVADASPFSALPPGKEKSVEIEFTLAYNVYDHDGQQ